jgi:mono/diheme cytochrome c family protein
MLDIRGRRFRRWLRCFVLVSATCAAPAFAGGADPSQEAGAQPKLAAAPADSERGRLLYETHCIGCHTTQAHWRDKHIVQSWADLLYQVTRMQGNIGQQWGESEIIDVAAYLNDLFYKLPCPVPGCRGEEARIDQRPALARTR